MSNEIKVMVEHTFSEEFIEDILTTAVECNDMTASWCRQYDATGSADLAKKLFNGESVMFMYDNPEYDEDESGSTEVIQKALTMSMLREAFTLVGTKYPETLRNFAEENYDADDADVLLQLALLGEVVYG